MPRNLLQGLTAPLTSANSSSAPPLASSQVPREVTVQGYILSQGSASSKVPHVKSGTHPLGTSVHVQRAQRKEGQGSACPEAGTRANGRMQKPPLFGTRKFRLWGSEC